MIRIDLHRKFVKDFDKLPHKIQERVNAKIKLFSLEPFSAELNNHILTGRYKGYRNINITGDYRALYIFPDNGGVLFVRIGTHAQLYD